MYRNHSWFHDNPVGDPLGGPAFGKYQDPSLIGLIGTGLGAIVGARGARGAASDLTSAAERAGMTQQDFIQRAINQQNLTSGLAGQLINPQRITGGYAQQALAQALGLPQTTLPGIDLPGGGRLEGTQALGAPPAGSPLASAFTPFSYGEEQFKSSPGYQFALDQGLRTIEQNAAARGMTLSPNTIQELQKYSTGLASQDFQQQYQNAYQAYIQNQANVLNALGTQAGQGTLAGTNLAGALGTSGSNISSLLSGLGGSLAGLQTGAGSAAAAGRVGASNALTGGLSNLSNVLTAGRMMGGGGGGYGAAAGDLLSGISPGLAGGLGDMLGMSLGGTYGTATQAGLDALIGSLGGFEGGAAGAAAAGGAAEGLGAAGLAAGAEGAAGAGASGAASGLGAMAGVALPAAVLLGGVLSMFQPGTSPADIAGIWQANAGNLNQSNFNQFVAENPHLAGLMQLSMNNGQFDYNKFNQALQQSTVGGKHFDGQALAQAQQFGQLVAANPSWLGGPAATRGDWQSELAATYGGG